MSLIDFAPWDYEFPEQKQEREQRKFRSAVEPVWSSFVQQEQEAEVGRFRDLIQPTVQAAQQEDEVQKFRSMVQPTFDQFAASESPTGMFSDRFDEVNKFQELMDQEFSPPEGAPSPSVVAPGYRRTATGGVERFSEERLQELNPPPKDTGAAGLFESFIPDSILEGIRSVPLVGPPAADVIGAGASPIGVVAAGAGLVSPAAAGMFAAGTVGSIGLGAAGQGLEELGLPDIPTPIGDIGAKDIGEVAGGLWAGPGRGAQKAARPFARGLEEQGGVSGVARRLATEETGGTKIPGSPPATPEDFGINQIPPVESAAVKFRTFAEGQRGKIAKTEAERSVERGSRLAASEKAYQDAIAKGMSEEEALARQQAALRGEYAGVGAEGIGWTDVEQQAIRDRVNTFDFGRGTGPDFERARARVALSKVGKVALEENELATLEKVLPEFGREIRRMQATGFKDWGPALYDLATLQKTVLSAGDASYPGRQGVIISLAHPVEAVKSLVAMAKAAKSSKYAQHLDDMMRTDERIIKVALESGRTTDVTLGEMAQDTGLFRALEAGLTSSEEVARSRLAYRIPIIGPIVKASNRSFATYGNKIRFETFATVIDGWARQGVDITPEKLQALSNALNRESGVGTLKGFVRVPGTKTGLSVGSEAFEKALQIPFWAPKYRVSHAQFALNLLHPDAQIRALAARDLSIFFGTGMSLLAFAKMSGVADEVGLDPTSSDFGKVRIGNTRINFWGTSQVLARSVAKLATGDVKGAARYFQSGLAPEWSLAYDAYQGRNYLGQPMRMDKETWIREAQQRGIPLAMQDIKAAIEEAAKQPTLEKGIVAGAMVPFSLLGGTANTYEVAREPFEKAFEEKMNRKYDSQAGDRMLAEADPALAPLLKKWEEDQIQRGSEGAVQRQGRQAFLADYEKQLGLPETAQKILGGNKAIMSQFTEDFEAYQTAAAIAAASDMFGVDIKKSDDPRAVIFRQWAEIRPNTYRDPQTGATNWDNYYKDKEAALAKLDPQLQSVIETRLRSSDPQIQQVEAQLKQAKNDAKTYWNIPKYKGLTLEQGDRLDAARQAIDYLTTARAPYRERLAIVKGLSPEERRVYYSLKSGSTFKQDSRRDQFLMDHIELADFGLVSLNTLSRKQRRTLPQLSLESGLSPAARELVGAR